MTDLAELDAVALLAAFRSRKATPVDALEAAERRMDAREAELNAMTGRNPQARREAEASAARWRTGSPAGALDGVPVTVKDSLVAAGMPATYGSPAYRDLAPEWDELPVARVRRAGAVVLGKTNLPEFALEGYTDNALFGATGNPWNPDLTPGGSTGGGAASVAAGYAPVALGTDAGGSLRRPAAHCGLFSLKTSVGRIPRRGGLPALLLDFDVAGALTRSLRDTRLLYEIMAGPAPDVPGSLFPPDRPLPDRPLRILAVERLGDAPLDPAIVASFRDFAARLAAAGFELTSGQLPIATEALAEVWPEIGRIHLAHLFAAEPHRAHLASPKYRVMAEEGALLPATRLVEILARVAAARVDAAALFQTVDAVVTPTIAALSWPKRDTHPETIDGKPVGPRGHAIYTGWVNAAGLPALALPVKPAPDGARVGVQIVTAVAADALALTIADLVLSAN